MTPQEPHMLLSGVLGGDWVMGFTADFLGEWGLVRGGLESGLEG